MYLLLTIEVSQFINNNLVRNCDSDNGNNNYDGDSCDNDSGNRAENIHIRVHCIRQQG